MKTVLTTTRQTLPSTTPIYSNPDWKPQPSSLTREEIRRIVIEQLG